MTQSLEGSRRSWRRPVFLVETGPLFGLSVPRGWPSWTGNSGWSCSEQRQSSRPASRSWENPFHTLMTRILTRPKNQPSPFHRPTTLHSMENHMKQWLVFCIGFSTPRTIVDQGICRIAIPIFAVFAVRPCSSAVILSASLVWIVFVLSASGTASRFLCTSSGWILWGWSLGESNVENWFPKTFSCNPDWFHVSSAILLSRLSEARELGVITGWLGTWDNLPLLFDSTSWNLQNHT